MMLQLNINKDQCKLKSSNSSVRSRNLRLGAVALLCMLAVVLFLFDLPEQQILRLFFAGYLVHQVHELLFRWLLPRRLFSIAAHLSLLSLLPCENEAHLNG